jgi:hypothetical protein
VLARAAHRNMGETHGMGMFQICSGRARGRRSLERLDRKRLLHAQRGGVSTNEPVPSTSGLHLA